MDVGETVVGRYVEAESQQQGAHRSADGGPGQGHQDALQPRAADRARVRAGTIGRCRSGLPRDARCRSHPNRPPVARRILHELFTQHPNADTELHYSNPYELLVATILSAQCTDERVNQVTPALFRRYPDARTLAKATTDELEPQIQSTGFFRAKSRSLVGMSTEVVEHHAGEIPRTMDGTDRTARRRPEDRERRPRSRARRAGPSCRSPRAACLQSDRHRPVRRSSRRRTATECRAASRGMDAGI